ncbi:hypothetical protein [Candidatus Liberibacter brunswickensis]|uniref:hypothetical protein n=1 Tax=Candidatus Liberibacter brunswickensis TaxID=1968796 RepID=UPI002FE08897
MIGIAITILLIYPYNHHPDLLISEDGKLVALVNGSTLILNNDNPPNFILSQWKSALTALLHEPPIKTEYISIKSQSSLKEILQLMNPKKFLCLKKLFCSIYHKSGLVISVLKRKDKIQLACKLSDIIITTIKNINPQLCNVSLLITPEILRKNGSLEIKIIPTFNENDKLKFTIKKSIARNLLPWTKNRI